MMGMVLNRYRENVKGYLEAMVRPLARAGVTPNQITVLGLLISLIGGAYFFYRGGSRSSRRSFCSLALS